MPDSVLAPAPVAGTIGLLVGVAVAMLVPNVLAAVGAAGAAGAADGALATGPAGVVAVGAGAAPPPHWGWPSTNSVHISPVAEAEALLGEPAPRPTDVVVDPALVMVFVVICTCGTVTDVTKFVV